MDLSSKIWGARRHPLEHVLLWHAGLGDFTPRNAEQPPLHAHDGLAVSAVFPGHNADVRPLEPSGHGTVQVPRGTKDVPALPAGKFESSRVSHCVLTDYILANGGNRVCHRSACRLHDLPRYHFAIFATALGLLVSRWQPITLLNLSVFDHRHLCALKFRRYWCSHLRILLPISYGYLLYWHYWTHVCS